MNYYSSGAGAYPSSQPQRHEYQNQHQQYPGGALGFAPIPEAQDQKPHFSPQHLAQLQSMQKQSAFHTRVREMYFANWTPKPAVESPWQGHKNPKVYEGDKVHCFNSYCQQTFQFPKLLVAHILNGECGEITPQEISSLVRDWKALQIELSRCGKLTPDEISCIERAWDLLHGEQQKGLQITQELIGFLVLAWEILSGNRSGYTLTQPTAPTSFMQEEHASSLMQESSSSGGDGDQVWRARFRYSTANFKR